MKTTICFSQKVLGEQPGLLKDVELVVKDTQDLKFNVYDKKICIEGCIKADDEHTKCVNGNIECIHWTELQSSSTNTDKKSSTTFIIQVEKPKNHFITLHCNFQTNNALFMDSFQCINSLEMYPELKKYTKDLKTLLVPVAMQEEIDSGFIHALVNSLTVEWSQHLIMNPMKCIAESNVFQCSLEAFMTNWNQLTNRDNNALSKVKQNVNQKFKSAEHVDIKTLDSIKSSFSTVGKPFLRKIEVYIELQYAKRVADNFLMLLQKSFNIKSSLCTRLWSTVNSITKIKDLKEPFTLIESFDQLKNCAKYLDTKSTVRFFKRFRELCHCNPSNVKEIEIEETNFLKAIKTQMIEMAFHTPSASADLLEIMKNASKLLDNKHICKYLLQNISDTNDATLPELKIMALKLLDGYSESFFKSIVRLIEQFYEKTSTTFVSENCMDIFRCKGTFVNLQTIITKITENQILFETCSQIEIQAELYFYVNSNLTWKGKNVIIITDTIVIDQSKDKYVFDVSGKDGTTHASKNARNGTTLERDGLAGEPGKCGESGGNVQIIANVIKNSEYISVISNGGNGSDGQDGGRGADGVVGEDGLGISEEDFNKRFPDLAYLAGYKAGENLKIFQEKNKFVSMPEEHPPGWFANKNLILAPDLYLKGETDDKYAIEYGFWTSGNPFKYLSAFFGLSSVRESYCFCSGQPGTSGTPGGDGGIGGSAGKGGFQGIVDIRNWKDTPNKIVKTICIDGKSGLSGENGIGGKGGHNGRKGNDRAHVCSSQAESTTIIAGHLKVVSCEKKSGKMAYCPKRKRYIEIKRKEDEYIQKYTNGSTGQNSKREGNQMTENLRGKKAPILSKLKENVQHIFCVKDDRKNLEDIDETEYTFSSNPSVKYERKTIKDTGELDCVNCMQHIKLTSVCNTKDMASPNDETDWKAGKKQHFATFPENEIRRILEKLSSTPMHTSMKPTHFENFLCLCFANDKQENQSLKLLDETNRKRTIANFKFYLLEKLGEMADKSNMGKGVDIEWSDLLKTRFQHLIIQILVLPEYGFNQLESIWLRFLKGEPIEGTVEDMFLQTYAGQDVKCISDQVEYNSLSDSTMDENNKFYSLFESIMDKCNQCDSDTTFEKVHLVEHVKSECFDKSYKKNAESLNRSDVCSIFDINLECQSDIINLLTWAKLKFTNTDTVCCIIRKLRYVQYKNTSLTIKCLKLRLVDQCCHISGEFLLWFLMSLLDNQECIENGKYLRMLAVTKPEKWIFEWIIQKVMCRSDFKDEIKCRELLSKIEGRSAVFLFLCRYLSKLPEREHMTRYMVEVMMGTLHKLNSTVEESFLSSLEVTNIFEWKHKIQQDENIRALKAFSWENNSLSEAAFYSSQIVNKRGREFIACMCRIVKDFKVERCIFLSALKRLYGGSLDFSVDDMKKMKSTGDVNSLFETHCGKYNPKSIEKIVSEMKVDSNSTLASDEVEKIEKILTKINNSYEMQSVILMSQKCINMFTVDDIKKWSYLCKQKLKSNTDSFLDLFTEIVLVTEKAITLIRSFRLRDTQKISIIAFFFSSYDAYRGILQQMSTGEGKTIVIVALSILKSLKGETVDIITSSSVLAKRDSCINKDIFDLFQISVSNNCMEDKHDRQYAYSSSVVFGEIGTFQRDILLTEFYNENIIEGRDRLNVIVDEVDSMLLDKSETVLYLAHEIAGIDVIEFVYTHIWSLVHSDAMVGTDDDRRTVRRCMLDSMYGLLYKENIHMFFPLDEVIDFDATWKMLQKEKIIDDEGRLLTRMYADFDKLEINTPCKTAGYVINMLKDTVRKGNLVEVPKFLEPFIDEHLDTWIRNAFRAKYMEEGEHFIIDINRTEVDRGNNVNIVIMDIDTGTEQYHMQWNSGLHQFLQLKYKCAISVESLKAVFMSNIFFFCLYTHLYGLTGTLGSQKERDLLKDVYNVSYITIPTFQETKFYELDTIVCETTDAWKGSIIAHAEEIMKTDRPVLVICETIHLCDEIEKRFDKEKREVFVYKNSYCELSFLKNEELDRACIILATNLAGRGTDILISERINLCGGLHVIVTYLPSNVRIEEQAFGRAARKGQAGSGQLIICDENLKEHQKEIPMMKIQRDNSENERISKIQHRYETFIRAEERLFKTFLEFYRNLKEKLISKKTNAEFQKVILEAVLDRWAFWLDSIETSLEKCGNLSTIMDKQSLFLKAVDVSIVHQVSLEMVSILQSPSQLVKAGKAIMSTSKYDEAEILFDHVIKTDPLFSESALYYKANCLLKKGKCSGDNFEIIRTTFERCNFLIQQRIEKLRNAEKKVEIISIQNMNTRESCTISEGLTKQKENAIQIYQQILNSVYSITGYAIDPLMFLDDTMLPLNANLIFCDLDKTNILCGQKIFKYPPEESAWKSIEDKYELYSKEIFSQLYKLKDSSRVTAEDFKSFIPCREELWDYLKITNVLKDEYDCILIHEKQLERSRSTLPNHIMVTLEALKGILVDDIKEYVFLYPYQKDSIIADKYKIISRETFVEKLGSGNIFHFLQKENIVSQCLFAHFVEKAEKALSACTFLKFDQINHKSFISNDISTEKSKAIFTELVEHQIVSSDGRLKTQEKIENIWLPTYGKFATEIRNIIEKCSKYRICATYLLKEMEFPLDLSSHPHNELFRSLTEAGIITPFKVAANISAEEMTTRLTFLYGDDSKLPKILLSEITEELKLKLITTNICKLSDDKTHLICVMRNADFQNDIKEQTISLENEIICFVSCRLQNNHNIRGLVEKLDNWREGLSKIDNVDTELKSIAENFTEEQLIDLCDDILSTTNNGFGEFIVLDERKWTLKSVCTMISILVLGITQIGIAMAIEFYSVGTGTFLANSFLSEGIGDIIYATECMISGHCTLQSYIHHKELSLAITICSAGIGAFVARGAKFSKFGHKIGGKFLQDQSGSKLMEQNVSKILLAKAASKRIGKKLVELSTIRLVDKGVDLAIDAVLRARLEKLCGAIVKKFADKEHDTKAELENTFSLLVRMFGKEQTIRKVNILIKKSFIYEESDVSKVLNTVSKFFADGVGNGLKDALKKLQYAGDSRVDFYIRVIEIVDAAVKLIDISNAVHEVSSLRCAILEKLLKLMTAEQSSTAKSNVGEVESKSLAVEQICIVINKANEVLSNYVEKQLEYIFVKPMLLMVGNKVRKKFYQGVNEMHCYGKKILIKRKYSKKKAEHDSELQQTSSGMKGDDELQYRKEILNLLKKTKNPYLFADIIEEDIPLSIHFVQAISEITDTIINIQTVGGGSLIMPQTFTPSGQKLGNKRSINLRLNINTDTNNGCFVFQDSKEREPKYYDCLLIAVIQNSREQLERKTIVETIRNSKKMRKNVEKGIHEYFNIK